MATRDIVVVGASAGGVEALTRFVKRLPADLRATVLVVLHTPTAGAGALARILARAGGLPARPAQHGDPLKPGEILVAPPDLHLLARESHVHLSRGPRENGHRPAVDTLFRSAASALGPRVMSVVLSGVLDDGAAGSVAVRRRGGMVMVQDPDDAMYDGMPRSVMTYVEPDYLLPVEQLADTVAERSKDAVGALPPGVSRDLEFERRLAEVDMDEIDQTARPGNPSPYTCPECSGTLWQMEEADAGLLHFRCRVGHAYSPDSLIDRQGAALEAALWTALRALEERATLCRRLGDQAELNGRDITAVHFRNAEEEARQGAELVRQVLVNHEAEPRLVGET